MNRELGKAKMAWSKFQTTILTDRCGNSRRAYNKKTHFFLTVYVKLKSIPI